MFAEQKDKSYIKFDATSASQGEVLYNANCASCHGNPGKNNTLKSLNPIPPDLGGSTTNALTDGELLYILNTGRGVMPSFKKRTVGRGNVESNIYAIVSQKLHTGIIEV